MDGWIKIHRQSLNSSVMAKPKTWYIWCWCLMKATHVSQKFPFNGKDVELKPGQFITGRSKALKELKKITPMSYRIALDYLKTTNRITIKTTNKFTIISICNWDEYQVKTTSKTTSKTTNQQPTSNQPATTYKNNKNKKNDKNNINNLTKDDFNEIRIKYGISIKDVIEKYDDMVLWAKEKPGRTRGRNWKFTLMNWLRKDIKDGKISIIKKGESNDPLVNAALS